MESNGKRVSVIIPAYNEAQNLGRVLSALTNRDGTDWEIIVVDDGSQDGTGKVAASYPTVRLITHSCNRGKGAAIITGAQSASCETLLLLDADLINLTERHARNLVSPVLEEGYAMSIGIFKKGRFFTDLAQFIAPFISGQRALLRNDLLSIPGISQSGFGAEIIITKWFMRRRRPVKTVVLDKVSHVMKEEKYGMILGLLRRLCPVYCVKTGGRTSRRGHPPSGR